MSIGRYSVGTGDRFGKEGVAQVMAFEKLKQTYGVDVDIVWNKSNREHITIHTEPADQRKAADEAIAATGWHGQYFVDADHIGLSNLDWFIGCCDFWTIDVTDCIGKPTGTEQTAAFLASARQLLGMIEPVGTKPIKITEQVLQTVAERYLFGVEEARRIYDHLVDNNATIGHIEVSMDESPQTQSPAELYAILFAIAQAGIPIDTVAVKFQGRFNKGIDYVGDVGAFLTEFRADVAVVKLATTQFGLHENLKLSVHTGSDKFSLYPGIGRIVRELDAGLHLKTAGTTWLEELIGLAEADGPGLSIAKQVYRGAHARFEELTAPYTDVIDIDRDGLPSPDEVDGWTSRRFASALRHNRSNPEYDPNVRQLLHVGYKVAAELGEEYLAQLDACRADIERNVTENLYERHLKPLFAS